MPPLALAPPITNRSLPAPPVRVVRPRFVVSVSAPAPPINVLAVVPLAVNESAAEPPVIVIAAVDTDVTETAPVDAEASRVAIFVLPVSVRFTPALPVMFRAVAAAAVAVAAVGATVAASVNGTVVSHDCYCCHRYGYDASY